MSYYHYYRKHRHYYNHYKRPNYYQNQPLYYKEDSFGFWRVVLVFIISYFLLLSFSILKYLSILLLIIFVVAVIISYKKRKIKKSISNILEEQIDIAQINSEKHGCKCYMEGLTPGERRIAHLLSEGLSYKDYFIFNNLIIPSTQNGSSQIDHLVVSKFGIFVIESKDYKGWIFGDKEQENWTQSLPGGRSKFQFQNPIRQNWSHVMSLKSLIPFVPEDTFKSLVVFTDSCKIKSTPIENVVCMDDLVKYIQNFKSNILSEENIQLIIGKLSFMCQTIDISPSQHIENIKSHHNI